MTDRHSANRSAPAPRSAEEPARLSPPAGRSPLLVAITGATGATYGLTLVRRALEAGVPVRLTFTNAARRVVPGETGKTVEEWSQEFAAVAEASEAAAEAASPTAAGPGSGAPPEPETRKAPLFALDDVADIGAPGASGSFRARGMVIAPCSMGTLARVAQGVSGNLVEREADVCLKERRPLVLLAREAPLSAIHLRNMLAVTEAGAIVLPPVPAFYARPRTVEELVGHTVDRALDLLGISPAGAFRWGAEFPGAAATEPIQ